MLMSSVNRGGFMAWNECKVQSAIWTSQILFNLHVQDFHSKLLDVYSATSSNGLPTWKRDQMIRLACDERVVTPIALNVLSERKATKCLARRKSLATCCVVRYRLSNSYIRLWDLTGRRRAFQTLPTRMHQVWTFIEDSSQRPIWSSD